MNGHAQNGHATGKNAAMDEVVPESHSPLCDADPEVYNIIEQEKVRQW